LSHNLVFNPILIDLPFQIEICTDTEATVLKDINPVNFVPDDTFLSLYTTINTHIIKLVEDTQTRLFRIRNLINDIPGSWCDSIILNTEAADDTLVPFFVEVIPAYTIFSLNLRWILTDTNGIVFGPYLPNVTKYITPGDYTLSLQDLAAKNYYDYQISTNTIQSKQIFIDNPIGFLKVNTDLTYYTISDFGDNTLSDKYSNIKYELEVGKHYIIIKDNNKLISTNTVIIEENMETII